MVTHLHELLICLFQLRFGSSSSLTWKRGFSHAVDVSALGKKFLHSDMWRLNKWSRFHQEERQQSAEVRGQRSASLCCCLQCGETHEPSPATRFRTPLSRPGGRVSVGQTPSSPPDWVLFKQDTLWPLTSGDPVTRRPGSGLTLNSLLVTSCSETWT